MISDNKCWMILLTNQELGWAMRAMGRNPTESEILELMNEVLA